MTRAAKKEREGERKQVFVWLFVQSPSRSSLPPEKKGKEKKKKKKKKKPQSSA